MSSLSYLPPSSLNAVLSAYLADPSNFPPEFKNWVTAWIEAFPPAIPITQIVGYTVAAASALVTVPEAVVSGTVETAFLWDTKVQDAQAMYSSAAKTRLTCKNAGTYAIMAFLDWGTNVTGERAGWVRKNGATHFGGNKAAASANGAPVSASGIINLAVNDYVEATGFQNSGGNLTPAGYFTAVRLGP